MKMKRSAEPSPWQTAEDAKGWRTIPRTRRQPGTTVSTWLDPPTISKPTRLNAFSEHPHRRAIATVGVEVEVTATVAGVEGEVDANLGGRLFSFFFAELPSLLVPSITSPAGQSSVQRFTPIAAGHHTLKLKRPEGGAILLHVDAL